ncbi:DNA primase [Ralstonia phage RSB3]|uniref:Putative DNA primase n=1 Tax=Ralstonia phage RSB3 TaxID=1402875 RepID=U3TFL8_9CAUD|nr:DNA primase [Ralstonia phage RSB3]BAN92327.1 putative DNA primase [Ralstonia phage RSB3]
MARLRNEEWLHLAKGTPVGSQRRVRHGSERTEALTVGNRDDRWWAYCQRCKTGAVEMKTHVLLTGKPPPKSCDLALPTDSLPISHLPSWRQSAVAAFLASKQMDLAYFPPRTVTFSEERQRLMLHIANGWMGRDTSGLSPQKWLTFNRQHYEMLTDHFVSTNVLLVEDCFSLLKVAYACPAVTVICTLGTAIHDSLMLRLMREAKCVVSFYDGDAAGWSGCTINARRLRAVNIAGPGNCFQQCAPKDLDPKDMTIADIQRHVEGLLTTS